MCLMCQGWTPEDVLEHHLQIIERHGWSVLAVERYGSVAGFAYTVGLSLYEGHPELLVSGLDPTQAADLLNTLGEQVRDGARFEAGTIITSDTAARLQFIRVNNPLRLVQAQYLFARDSGLVPALQVVWSDPEGRWPRKTGRPGARGAQPLFGRLLNP